MAIRELNPMLLLQLHHPLSCDPSHNVAGFRIRDFPLVAARNLSNSSISCYRGRASGEDRAIPNGDKKGVVEKLWRQFFSDPTEWQDHRMNKATPKGNPNFPDFKHKTTKEGLWLNSKWRPQWVEAELASIPPGTLELTPFSWNQRLNTCVRAGQYKKTMQLFQQMQREGINLDRFTIVPVLNACAGLGVLEDGQRIHTQIIQNGFGEDIYVGNSLIDMYAKCGSIEDAERVFKDMPMRDEVTWNAMLSGYVKCGSINDAERVFNKIPARDVVSWTAMILGYVNCGEGQKALELFEQMQCEGVDPNSVTFVAVLNACASVAALEEGRRVHGQIIHRGYESNIFIGNSLIDMYAKCGSIDDAERVFTAMPTRDVVAWTAMLAGYGRHGYTERAIEHFKQMCKFVEVNDVTFVSLL